LVQAAKTYGEERKKQFEVEQKEYEIQLEKMEKIMEVKAFSFQKREGRIAELKRALEQEEKSAHELRAQASALGKEISNALIRITGITPDRAKQDIISFYEEEFKKDAELRQASLTWGILPLAWQGTIASLLKREGLIGSRDRFLDATKTLSSAVIQSMH